MHPCTTELEDQKPKSNKECPGALQAVTLGLLPHQLPSSCSYGGLPCGACLLVRLGPCVSL